MQVQTQITKSLPEKSITKVKYQVPAWVSLLSGGIAGGVEAATTYPFEYSKTRMQLPNSKLTTRNPLLMITQIVRTEGLASLYTGCSALIVGTMLKASVRFACYDSIKNLLVDNQGRLSPLSGILAGMMAGFTESIIAVTPTERIKTVLIDNANTHRQFKGVSDAVGYLVREQGIRGLFKGLVPTTMKQAGTSAVRMGSYNILKELFKSYHIPQTTASTFAMGSCAGIITVYATQPLDTIKTMVQTTSGSGTLVSIKTLFRQEGLTAFWKGSTMRLGRLIFSGGIVFSVYEKVADLLKQARLY